VATYRQHLPIFEFCVAAFGEAAVAGAGEGQIIPKHDRTDDPFTRIAVPAVAVKAKTTRSRWRCTKVLMAEIDAHAAG
jgi:hypothetical protein